MRALFLITLFFVSTISYSQGDSLLNIWNDKSNSDSIRLKALGKYSMLILQNNPDSTEKIADIGIELSKKNKMVAQEAFFWNSKGGANLYKGNFFVATKAYQKSIELYEGIGVSPVTIYGNLGTVYYSGGEYEKAIKYFINALEGINAEDYNTKAQICHNIGSAYINQKKFEKALEYLYLSYNYRVKQGDSSQLAITFNQISETYRRMGNIDSAKTYVKKAVKLMSEDDLYSKIWVENNLAEIEFLEGNYSQSIQHSKNAMKAAKMTGNISPMLGINNRLSGAYEKLNKIDSAYYYFKEYTALNDSINNAESAKKIVEAQLNFEHEKETALKEKEHQAQLIVEKSRQEKQKVIIIAVVCGLIILIIGMILLFNRFKITKHQKLIIEEKNKEITDSINYAKRIQGAILPPIKTVKEFLPNSFILYKPKDIVAGDFYWLEHKEGKVLFAAADCTGHGVPGAMVSVVCNNGLNRSVREYGLTEPGKILNKTREIVIAEFEKSEEEVKDGMDIALCSLDGNKLEYAGANNPLWIVRHAELDAASEKEQIPNQVRNDEYELIEIKADKQPIGKYAENKPYTTHKIELQKGDSIYIFTDGYADQFGGEKSKKFKAANFKKLLLSIQEKTMEEQRDIIDQAFKDWKGNLEQIDDVCIIGVRI